ncbi:MAG: hypothetical protein Q9187_005596 [Circinaria calcarea]
MSQTDGAAVMPTYFPFLRLPREIRDMVYGYATNLPRYYARKEWSPSDHKRTPGILLVSRCIHAEAKEVLYQQHLIVRTEDVTQDEIFARLSRTLLQRVRHVTLVMSVSEVFGRSWSPVAKLLYLIWNGKGTFWNGSHSTRTLKTSISVNAAEPKDYESHLSRLSDLHSLLMTIGGISEVKIGGGPIPFEPAKLMKRDCERRGRILRAYEEEFLDGTYITRFHEWWSLADQKGPYKRDEDCTGCEE